MKSRNAFWEGPTYGVIQAMKSTGNYPGIITQWIALAHQWALDHRGPEAQAIRDWLPTFQARPFYTANELVHLFPALVAGLGLSEKPPKYSAGRLANELDYGGLPCLKHDDGTYFFRNPVDTNRIERYYIVERIHYWSRLALSQEGFENAYFGKE